MRTSDTVVGSQTSETFMYQERAKPRGGGSTPERMKKSFDIYKFLTSFPEACGMVRVSPETPFA